MRSLLVVCLVVSCSAKEGEVVAPDPLRPVRTMEVVASGAERVRTFAGVTQAGMESKLSFKVGGTIERVLVKVGQKVEKGELLAELDDKDFRLQLQQTQAGLAQAKALERNAETTYSRTRQLYENGSASRSDLDAARTAHEAAQASTRSLVNQIELARSRLSYTRLVAPTAGAISRCTADASENIGANKVIIHLSAGSMPEVKVTVPEVYIAQLQAGADATVTIGAIKEKTFAASVTEVGVASEAVGATFSVVARLSETSSEIRPGMAAELAVRFPATGGDDKLQVPPIAVGEDRSGRFVYVVERIEGKLGVVRRREVTTGELSSEGLEVVSGLSDGDILVTAGVSRIRDGLEVTLMD